MSTNSMSFDESGWETRVEFLKQLLDEGTPNVPWIAHEHEEMLRAVWDDQEEVVGPGGQAVSPRLHLALHGIVERQYGSGEPPVVQQMVDHLLEEGLNRHEAMHTVCTANADELLLQMRDDESFNECRFTERLLRLVARSPRLHQRSNPPAAI